MPTSIYDKLDRETLGKRVREKWIDWAKEQPQPKPSWLVPWEELSEADREVDRRIGETIAREAIMFANHVCFYCGDAATHYTIDGADSKLVCADCPSANYASGS